MRILGGRAASTRGASGIDEAYAGSGTEVRVRAALNLIARAFSWLLLRPVVTMGLRTVVSAIGLGRLACRLGWHCWTPRWRDRSVGPRDGSELERRCATCGLLRPASS